MGVFVSGVMLGATVVALIALPLRSALGLAAVIAATGLLMQALLRGGDPLERLLRGSEDPDAGGGHG